MCVCQSDFVSVRLCCVVVVSVVWCCVRECLCVRACVCVAGVCVLPSSRHPCHTLSTACMMLISVRNPHFPSSRHENIFTTMFNTVVMVCLFFRGFCCSHHNGVRSSTRTENFAPQACSCWPPCGPMLGPCWRIFWSVDFALKTNDSRIFSYVLCFQGLYDFHRRKHQRIGNKSTSYEDRCLDQ